MGRIHRELKHHEQKLLRQHDFELYRSEKRSHEGRVVRQYYLQDREDYQRYNILAGRVTRLADMLKTLPPSSKVRIEITRQLVTYLYNLGVIDRTDDLSAVHLLSTASFCKRRLAVVLVRLNMAPNNQAATTFIEQGHVRIGPNIIRDPGFLVSRSAQDVVTWGVRSSLRRKAAEFGRTLDDYDVTQ
eukprot:TRINITY_DN25401_c0_g1_i1.p1 TRINITY_DN25401_c0_g1~~TRINITY_DN25401_c0_g1_i1.p1  ORF type:complete len:187 (-),score=31.60 TRINITY_DN25401_c0_g1_i1:89-649(-)